MAHNDKPESANEAQDHSQPLDEGGFFSLNDVIAAGRHQLTRSEHLLAADTRRNARNLLASAKLLALVVIVSLAMGVARLGVFGLVEYRDRLSRAACVDLRAASRCGRCHRMGVQKPRSRRQTR